MGIAQDFRPVDPVAKDKKNDEPIPPCAPVGREQPHDQLSGRETQQPDTLFDDRSGSDAGPQRARQGSEVELPRAPDDEQ